MSGKIVQISDPRGKGTGFWSDVFIGLVNDEQPRLARYHQIVNQLIKFFGRLPVGRYVSPVALVLI
jgi:hypothetical protein